MNELDSRLEKTSENVEIGSVEKKIQLLKGGNISKLFAGANFLHVFDPKKQTLLFDEILKSI